MVEVAQKKPFSKEEGAELDVFIGIAHRPRGETLAQYWKAHAKKGHKIAAADARSTKEAEDWKHTSSLVTIAVKRSCFHG